jgi:predicted DNA-binding transcriptional regulator AlpA
MAADYLTHSPAMADPPMLTEREVCARVRMSPAYVQALRRKGTGPRYVRIGKAVRYPEQAVADWLASLSTSR